MKWNTIALRWTIPLWSSALVALAQIIPSKPAVIKTGQALTFHGISRVESCLIPSGSFGKTLKSFRQRPKTYLTNHSPINLGTKTKAGLHSLYSSTAAPSSYGICPLRMLSVFSRTMSVFSRLSASTKALSSTVSSSLVAARCCSLAFRSLHAFRAWGCRRLFTVSTMACKAEGWSEKRLQQIQSTTDLWHMLSPILHTHQFTGGWQHLLPPPIREDCNGAGQLLYHQTGQGGNTDIIIHAGWEWCFSATIIISSGLGKRRN